MKQAEQIRELTELVGDEIIARAVLENWSDTDIDGRNWHRDAVRTGDRDTDSEDAEQQLVQAKLNAWLADTDEGRAHDAEQRRIRHERREAERASADAETLQCSEDGCDKRIARGDIHSAGWYQIGFGDEVYCGPCALS